MSLLQVLFSMMGSASGSGPTVSLNSFIVDNINTAPCWAKVKFGSDGGTYKSDKSGNYVFGSFESWLKSGLNSEVWMEQTANGPDALSLNTIGGSRVSMVANQELGIVEGVGPDVSFNIGEVRFYDAASGGNLLWTTAWQLHAERT